jgi:hypothetical protein
MVRVRAQCESNSCRPGMCMQSVRHRLLHIASRAWCIARIHRRCDTDPGEDHILSDVLFLQYVTAVSVLRVLHYVWDATKGRSSVMESAGRKELRKDKRTKSGCMSIYIMTGDA